MTIFSVLILLITSCTNNILVTFSEYRSQKYCKRKFHQIIPKLVVLRMLWCAPSNELKYALSCCELEVCKTLNCQICKDLLFLCKTSSNWQKYFPQKDLNNPELIDCVLLYIRSNL